MERKRWISEERFSAGLAFCTFLPGPEAQQLATYIGWSLHGVRVKLFQQLYLSFTQAALVTFGGAYAVLSYVTQAAVEQFHWLSRPEVIDGLALAEATPGPLIIVLQYVGFLAGWNDPGTCRAA